MKKNTLLLAGLLFINAAFSQDKKVMTKIFLMYTKENPKIEEIKTEVDKLVADPSNASNADVWAWKSTIDAEMTKTDELKAKCPDCLNSSFEAFKKSESLDKTLSTISSVPLKWKSLGIMYDSYYNTGRDFYKEKNYTAAFENFEKAAYFSNIIMKKDIRANKGALDTLPILMSAYAAQNAQKVNEALHYYSIAADFKFGGENDLDMYKYLIYNYSELKDKANFEKYYAIAQEKYPKENFEDYRFDFIAKNFSIDEKLAFYDAEDAKGTLSATAYMSLGDMFVNLRKEEKEVVEKDPLKKMALQTKGREAFKKAYQKGNDVLASFNVGVLYYNEYNQLDEQRSENVKKMQEINSTKTVEKDPKKKAAADAKAKEQIDPLKKANVELESKILPAIDNGIEWLEKAYTALKDKAEKTKTEKTSFKNAVKFLGLFYELKRDKVKGKDPKAYETFEIKSKQYYEVYDKL
jgi:hypothetical protein